MADFHEGGEIMIRSRFRGAPELLNPHIAESVGVPKRVLNLRLP